MGDTILDLPLLRMARVAIAFCPSPELRSVASMHGMTIVEEDHNRICIQYSGRPTQEIGIRELRTLQPDEVITLASA